MGDEDRIYIVSGMSGSVGLSHSILTDSRRSCLDDLRMASNLIAKGIYIIEKEPIAMASNSNLVAMAPLTTFGPKRKWMGNGSTILKVIAAG